MNRIAVSFMLIAYCIASHWALAQQKQGQAQLDYFLSGVPAMKEDTVGVKLMYYIAMSYCYINPDEGLEWAKKDLALAQKLDWRWGEGVAYDALGNNFQVKGNYPAALDASLHALRIFEELDDKQHIGVVSGNLGVLYEKSAQNREAFKEALKYDFQALDIAKMSNDINTERIIWGNIGLSYYGLGDYDGAFKYQLQSIVYARRLHDTGGIISQAGNLGATYEKKARYSVALKYMFEALVLSEKVGDKQGIATSLNSIGQAYYSIATQNAPMQADSFISASKEGNLANATKYLEEAIATSREIQLLGPLPGALETLSKALAIQGDYKEAFQAHQLYTSIKDSLFNVVNSEKITNLETKRAVELKDKDIFIAKLKKRNERILFAGGFAVLILVMYILFRNYRKQQHSNILLSKEKKRSDDLLLNILPAEVAEELKDKGGAAARQFDDVTVLFTDFVNFTHIAETLSPQVLVQELHECFTAFDAIIERNDLEKIKTIGDAYMAVCGLPVVHERHAQKCIQAAKEILAFMQKRSTNDKAFGIRIGVNSGPVVAGIVGVKKFAYDIWGDAVNTAARMEQHGERGRINISQSTYELVKDDFVCHYRGKIAAKNKGEVEMYFVEAGITQAV